MPPDERGCAMKISVLSVVVSLAILLGGCYSMEVGTNEALRNSGLTDGVNKPVEHVLVSNYGWYLFNCIPIVCGNASGADSFPWKFFTNHVDPVLLHDRMMAYANSKNASVKDLVFSRDEKIFFEIPEVSFPIPFFVCYHEVQISGVLVEKGARPAMCAGESGGAK
jgi:hypothetical protein